MKMDLHGVVMKLIGPVNPIGEHNADQVRLENIKVLTNLIDSLLFEIFAAAKSADRPEASMKAIGIHARDFLNEVKNS